MSRNKNLPFIPALMIFLWLVYSFWALPSYAQNFGNLSSVMLPSASRTATEVVSADINNPQWRGAHFIINVTAYNASTLTPTIQAKDPVSGTYYSLLVGNSISSTGTTVLKIYPGAATIANGVAADMLPKTFRIKMNASGVTPTTYSVGAFFNQ